MQVATAIGAAELPLKRSNQLLNQLWVTMKNTARWRLTTGALNAFIGGLQQAFGYSKSLNASLNDIRIVTGKSADEMSRFAKEANQAAKTLSTTTTTYTDASLIYYQQGLDDEAVKERTDTTIKMANVTGQAAETISQQMTAVWNNFDNGTRSLESYGDAMVALGASTATSSKEIAEGLEKFAPVANTVGLSFDYAAAALATITATTRESASVAGNALKTLFSRLEGLKLGETLDDGTDLNKYSQALYSVGINIKDVSGELKDMDTILDELGTRWSQLARDEQMALAETVGGVRQYAQLVALMDNWTFFQENLATARGSEGSLEKQAEIYAESWEASRDRVKAAAEDVYDSLINPKVFIDLDKMSQAVLKPLASILDGVGGLTGLLPIVAALMTKVYSAQIANVMRDMAVNIGLMTGKEQERARAIQAESAALIESLNIREEDDVALSTKLDLMQQEIKLQAIINENVDSLTQSQVEQIENEQVILNLLKQQVLQRTEDIKRLSERRNDLSEDMASSRFNNYTQELQTTLARIRRTAFRDAKNESIVIPLKFSISKTDVDKTYDSLKTNLDEILNKYGTLLSNQERLKNFGSPVGKTAEDMREFLKSIGQYSSELEGLNRNELWEKIKTLQSDAKGANISVTALRNAMAEIGIDQSHITEYIRLTEKLRTTEQLTADETERLKNLQEELGNRISQNLIKDTVDWADALVLASQAISQSAMAMRSLDNLGRIFSDETLDNGERLTQLLTTIGLLLPTIGSSVKAVTQAIAAGGLTLKTAFPILAAASVLIYGIIKVVDALHTSQKEALESIQKTTEAYKESQSDLEELNNELSTTQDRIKELQNLAESGSISIVEQEELKNLQIENEQLQRQVELKERLAKIKLTEAVAEIDKQGSKAYQFTKEADTFTSVEAREAVAEMFRNSGAKDAYLSELLKDNYNAQIYNNLIGKINTENNALSGVFTRQNAVDFVNEYLPEESDARAAFSKYIEAIYDDIENLREEYHEKWIAANADTYETLESNYSLYVEAIKADVRSVEDSKFKTLLKDLREARQLVYSKPGQYEETFLDSVLNQLSQEDLTKLYEASDFVGPEPRVLSEFGKDIALRYGVTEDELISQAIQVREKAKQQLTNFGLEDLVNDFSYIELKVLADNNFKTFEEFLNYLKTNAGIIPVTIQAQTAIDAKTEALAKIASGEFLDDELISKIQEAYQGIKDVSEIAALSVEDQIDLLSDNGTLLEKMIDSLTKREKQLQDQIDKAEKSEEEFKENAVIAFKAELSQVQDDLEKLRLQFEKDPIKIKVETSLEIAAELNNLKKAISLINDDLTVSAENLVELAKRYPEALVDAYYEEGQNVLKIEQSKYDGIKQLLEGDLDAHRDEQVQILNQEAQLAAATLAIVEAGESSKKEEYRGTLVSQLVGNQEALDSVKDTTFKALKAVVQNEIQKRQEQLETITGEVAGSKTATDTLAKNAEITAQNYSQAAYSILNAFDQAFRGIVEGSASAVAAAAGEGKYASILGYAYDQPIETKKGQTFDTTYEQNLNDVKLSKEWQTINNEIKHLKWLSTALDQFEAGDISLDTLQGFFDLLPTDDLKKAFSGVKSLASFDFTDTSEENIEKLVNALDEFYRTSPTAKSDLQAQLDEIVGAMQYLLESPEEDKTKSGSGDKPDYAKLDNADLEKHEDLLEEIEDRYHEITREIERQNRILDQLETQAERTYGLDRLKLYEKELKELNGLEERQIAKSGRAERYLAEVDKPRLQAAFQAVQTKEGASDVLSRYGFSGFSNIEVDLNKPGQEIKDYEALEDKIRQDTENFLVGYRGFMAEYDAFLQEYNALTDEEKAGRQEEAVLLQQEYELVTAQFELVEAQQEERLAAIKQYEETLDTINTLAHEIEETRRREEDTKLKEVTHRMDVILDVRDARKQIRDFTKEIAESFGDALTHGVRTAELGWDQAKDEMAMYKEYVQEYNDLKNLLDNANEYTDTDAIVAELRELEGNIIESGQRLLEWTEQVENMFVEALSAAADRFSYFTTQLEHNDTILATMKELYALQGQTYKTQQGFNRLQKVAQERLETQVAQARLQRKWFEEADSRLQEAQAQFDALIAEKGAEAEQDIRYDTLKKNRDALLKEQQEAQKEMLSYAQQAMETAQQMYLDQIEKAVYEFGQALSGGIGLDLLQDKYDHYIEEEERYLDKVNEAYQVAAWYDKLQKDIDNTSNKLTKERLKALQEEIDIRREGNTLSQYDLDILEAKYKVLQAQADLEDAQNAKSQLRLVRDSQGNWNYQFTTNPDDIAAKEQELLQAENEWYNLAKEQTKEVTGEIIATWQECQQAINEIYSDTSNFIMNEETGKLELTKEAQEKETEIRRFYAEKVKYLEEEKAIAIGDMTEAGNQAMIHMAIAAGETVEDITGITGRQVENLVETTGLSSQQLLQLSLSQIEDILENKLEDLANGLGISADELKNMLQRKEQGIESDADAAFRAILESADPATIDLYNLFAENWSLIGSLVGETSSGIKGNIADTYNKIQSGLNDTGTAMNLFDNIFAKDLTDMTKATGIFEVEFDRAVENMQNSFDNYGETIADVADDCGVSLEALDDSVNMVSDSTDKMIWEGLDAADALWQQVDATWDAQQGYLDLASAVWEYIYALQALAAEQVVPTIEEASGVDTFDEADNGYSYSGDLSQRMAQAWYNYSVLGIKDALEDFNDFTSERHAATKEAGITDDTDEIVNTLQSVEKSVLERMANKEIKITVSLHKEDAEKAIEVTEKATEYAEGYSFATGGYTGAWGDSNGRLAMLHEKELVLNAEDTQNILSAVSLVRSMDDIFGSIAEQLDGDGLAAMALLGSRIGGIGAPAPANTNLEQHVTIESVSFPGVTSSREIEEAFESLINDAAQWARRRKS